LRFCPWDSVKIFDRHWKLKVPRIAVKPMSKSLFNARKYNFATIRKCGCWLSIEIKIEM